MVRGQLDSIAGKGLRFERQTRDSDNASSDDCGKKTELLLVSTYFASAGGADGDGSEGRSLRSFFSSFLAFFSMSLLRFSN